MIVNCFTLNTLHVRKSCFHKKIKHIDIVYAEFGEDIPKYLIYEGGQGRTYLFCIDESIDVIKICKKYNYLIDDEAFHKMEINDETYNNDYTIYPTYEKHFRFQLRKI